MAKKLLKDLIIPAGTVFHQAPVKTRRYGNDHYQTIIGLTDNTSGKVEYCIDGDEEILADWFEDVPDVEEYDEPRVCRYCGCTDDDCSQCIAATGSPCYWIEWDLCSRCYYEKL